MNRSITVTALTSMNSINSNVFEIPGRGGSIVTGTATALFKIQRLADCLTSDGAIPLPRCTCDRTGSRGSRVSPRRRRKKGIYSSGIKEPTDDELSFHRGNVFLSPGGSRKVSKEKRYPAFAAIPGIFPRSESTYSSMACWKLLLYILESRADRS